MNANPVSISGLRLCTRSSEEGTVVRCSGRLTAEVTGVLKNEVRPLIPSAKRILLDFTDLKYMDSAGLGTIVGLYVSAQTHGCSLQLINMNKQIRNLLGITNLLTAFENCGKFLTKMP